MSTGFIHSDRSVCLGVKLTIAPANRKHERHNRDAVNDELDANHRHIWEPGDVVTGRAVELAEKAAPESATKNSPGRHQ